MYLIIVCITQLHTKYLKFPVVLLYQKVEIMLSHPRETGIIYPGK